MKTKSFFIATLIATNLLANSIDFQMAERSVQRVAPPNSTNEILSFNSSVDEPMKSVVNIAAKKHVSSNAGNIPSQMFNDPFLRRFFLETNLQNNLNKIKSKDL